MLFSARENLLRLLQKYVRGSKKVYGVDEALLIGYRGDLDRSTVQDYRNTGVVHIIIIAGMHLGLIAGGLLWLLSKTPYVKRKSALKTVLVISAAWLFALLTGAAVPVLRAAVMLTFVLAGQSFGRRTQTFNSLAASAFVLLCFDPFLLWDVGFQLSYAAVAGIVWLQRPLSRMIFTENKFLQKLRDMCALSVSAQVFTAPLCILYFHQLPLTFLVTNLLCVPIFTVILFGEIILLFISMVPAAAMMIGRTVYVLTHLMNDITSICNKMPFSTIDNIYATPLSTAILYGLVITLFTGIIKRKKNLFGAAVIFFAAFICCWCYNYIETINQQKIVIYNISKSTAIDFVDGNNFSFYGSITEEQEGFNLAPARQDMQATNKRDSLPGLFHHGPFWQFGKKTMMVIDSAAGFQRTSKMLQTDVLLICGNPALSIKNIVPAIMPAVVVFDASNSLWKIARWKKECEELHLRCFSTATQGAFILDTR